MLLLWCTDFSLQWLLLFWSMGSTVHGLYRLYSAQALQCTGSIVHGLYSAQALQCTGSIVHGLYRFYSAQALQCTGSIVHGLYSAQALQCTGSIVHGLYRFYSAQALQCTGSIVHGLYSAWASAIVAHRLRCSPQHVGSSQTRDQANVLHWWVDSSPLSHQGSPGPYLKKTQYCIQKFKFIKLKRRIHCIRQSLCSYK